MRTISVTKAVDAPQQAVWDVLYDFPNISQWNSGVTNSYTTGDTATGVGAQRHCDLKPMGELEETLAEVDAPNRAVVRIDSTAKLPIKKGEVEFLLSPEGDRTSVTVNYDYVARGGVLGKLYGPFLDRQLRSGFTGFIDDLGKAAAATPA